MVKNSVPKKPSIRLVCLAAVLVVAGAAVWWLRAPAGLTSQVSGLKSRVSSPSTGIVTTAVDSHRPLVSLSHDGSVRTLPADPALEEALSLTAPLPFARRLDAVHALQAATLSAAQIDFMRAFVADPRLPQGLTIQQLRALKNDVLNVVCVQPGQEAATAAMLRALYADETQDPGMRDYALQFLAGLAERDPSLGWATHWQALDGKNPDLAATALLHLSLRLRSRVSQASPLQVSSFRSQVSSPNPQVSGLKSQVSSVAPQVSADERRRIVAAALRLASDTAAKDTSRTTALQVCGQLKLTAARPLAYEIARSDKASFPFRIAAVATLGDLGGDAATHDYLAALTAGPEKRLRIPAQSALKRFTIN